MKMDAWYKGGNTWFYNRTLCNCWDLCSFYYVYIGTVKPVLRGHLWDKEKVAL
jgi:hypothetical protein